MGQVSSPTRSGYSPRQVSPIPPKGQDIRCNALNQKTFVGLNQNLLNPESFRCKQRRFPISDSSIRKAPESPDLGSTIRNDPNTAKANLLCSFHHVATAHGPLT